MCSSEFKVLSAGHAPFATQVGSAYQYSGCGSSLVDSTTFAETDCGSTSYDMCTTYTYEYDYGAAGVSGYVRPACSVCLVRRAPVTPFQLGAGP